MISKCKKETIKDSLMVDIDISNINSWNLNTDFDIVSLEGWNGSKVKSNKYIDYGLTAIDYGLTDSLESTHTIDINHTKLTFKRIGEFDGENIIYNNFEINDTLDENDESYLSFNGGYLQTCFKHFGYDYEILPYRYIDGVTFEVLINIDDNSKGIFLYLGTKAGDKYNNDIFNENNIYTSKNNPLNAKQYIKKTKENIYNFDLGLTDNVEYVFNQEDNYENNIYAFYLKDKKIGIKYVGDEGVIYNNLSNTPLKNGWSLVSIKFTPYGTLSNKEYDECVDTQKGCLSFYVNGKKIYNIEDFSEFIFKPLKNDKEKQIGVPYNISLGGGSVGLKNSWHYNKKNDILFDNTLIDVFNFSGANNYEYTNDGLIIINDVEFNKIISISYITPIEVLGGHINTIEFDFELFNIFDKYQINDIKLVLNNNDVEIVDYELINPINTKKYIIKLKYKYNKNGSTTTINPELLIISEKYLNVNGVIKLYKLKHTNYVDYVKNNNTCFVEENFNIPFYGGIQKFRMYNKSLTNNEIMNNFQVENNIKNISSDIGGRIIVNSVV